MPTTAHILSKEELDQARRRVAQQQGVNWAERQKYLKKAGRWHIETY